MIPDKHTVISIKEPIPSCWDDCVKVALRKQRKDWYAAKGQGVLG